MLSVLIKPEQFIFNFWDQTYEFNISWFITKTDTDIYPPFAYIYTKSFVLIRESFAFVSR